jgi:predicted nucleic acid-binding protein
VIVIDASALVELLVAGTPRAARLAARVRQETLHAPHLIDVEVLSVLRSLEARRTLTTAEATRAAQDLAALAMTRYPHDVLSSRIWQLRANLTSYDASYIALAESLRVPVVTCDAKLAGSPGHRATVELFAT